MGFNPWVKKVLNRFGEIFDSKAENHDKTHKSENQYITKLQTHEIIKRK